MYYHLATSALLMIGSYADNDECGHSDTCSHGCINTYGSYECVCPPGYHLEASGADNCIGKSSIETCLSLC